MKLTQDRWDRLTKRLGFKTPDVTYQNICACYLERWREYHNTSHIHKCLVQLDLWRELAKYPDEVEFALWMHDVVYAPGRGDNEGESANIARKILHDHNCEPHVSERVLGNILVTSHQHITLTSDERLTADIDLVILGAPRAEYERFEKAIQLEYKDFATRTFYMVRMSILQGFLDRKQIYYHDKIAECYDVQARDNLEWAIQRIHNLA